MRMIPPLKPNYDVYAMGNLSGFEDVPSGWGFDSASSDDSQEAIERSPGGYAFETNVMPTPVDYEPTLGSVDLEMMGDMSGRQDLFNISGMYNPFNPQYLPFKAAVERTPYRMGGLFDSPADIFADLLSLPGSIVGEAIKQADVQSGSGMFGKPSEPDVGVPFAKNSTGPDKKPQVIVATAAAPVFQQELAAASVAPSLFAQSTSILDGEIFGVSRKIVAGVAALAAGALYLAKRKKGRRSPARRRR